MKGIIISEKIGNNVCNVWCTDDGKIYEKPFNKSDFFGKQIDINPSFKEISDNGNLTVTIKDFYNEDIIYDYMGSNFVLNKECVDVNKEIKNGDKIIISVLKHSFADLL